MFITKPNVKWNIKNQVSPYGSFVMLSITWDFFMDKILCFDSCNQTWHGFKQQYKLSQKNWTCVLGLRNFEECRQSGTVNQNFKFCVWFSWVNKNLPLSKWLEVFTVYCQKIKIRWQETWLEIIETYFGKVNRNA